MVCRYDTDYTAQAHTSDRTHGQTWHDRAHLNRGAIWLLLIGAAVLVATILTLRGQRARHRLHG